MKPKRAYAVVAALFFSSQLALSVDVQAQQYRPYELLAKQAQLRGNMRTLQIAVESYATDAGGFYPRSIDFTTKTYYPGGQDRKKAGAPTENPFTGKAEWPVMGSIMDVSIARAGKPNPILPGVVEYSVILDGQRQPISYAIRGGDANGMTYMQNGKLFILSNDSEFNSSSAPAAESPSIPQTYQIPDDLKNITPEEAHKRMLEAQVRANMRTMQIAAESYATDTAGLYPTYIDKQTKTYFPKGDPGKTEGMPFVNPYANAAEWPIMGNLKDVATLRNSAPTPIAPGAIEYSVIFDSTGQPTSYAIRGGDASGHSLQQNGRPLILSNQ